MKRIYNYIISGVGEVYAQGKDGFKWREVIAGDIADIPGGMKHAWRNVSNKPFESMVTTNPALGRFFLEVGRPVQPGQVLPAPTPEELQHFIEISRRYGQWLGSPEENAILGIDLFGVKPENVST